MRLLKHTERYVPKPVSFGKYDTELLENAREKLFNVYNANYMPSDRKVRLLETIINKLDRLLEEYHERE